MVFGLSLGAGLKALNAAQLGIQTSGQNVANVNTPGYTRQRLLQSASLSIGVAGMQIGTGVQIADISRVVDIGLESRIRLQMGMFGSAAIEHQRMVEMEGAFGEPDNGLSSRFSEFFGAISELQTDPAERSLRGGLVQSGNALTNGFNLLARQIGSLRDSTLAEARGLVDQINGHARAIADLNVQIISLEVNSASANDLRDAREQHVKEITALIDTQVLERSTGSVDLLVGGHILVSGNRTIGLTATADTSGRTRITAGSSNSVLRLRSGRLHGLMAQESTQMPMVLGRLDEVARNLILEFNRRHTTGTPQAGTFRSLTSFYASADGDKDGMVGDEFLSQAGLPFAVKNGELYVNVTRDGSKDVEQTRVSIDPGAMSLRDLATAINDIDHLTAVVDPAGRLRINADPGHGFHFAPSVDPSPDSAASFGGTAPSLGTANGPFDLGGAPFPQTFDIVTGPASSPVTTNITLDIGDFVNPSVATVDELVAAINADSGSAATAENVGGRLVIRSASTGAQSEMQLIDGAGSPIASLGLSTALVSGQDLGVDIDVSGTFTGSANGQFVFVPDADGEIGVTDGLTVSVYDANGGLVATLDVGRQYSPGSRIDVADGISVSFGPGSVSNAAGHVFALDTIADSDTSDVLAALGLNSFFHGTGAADIAVNPALASDPGMVAAGLSAASGDGDNLGRFVTLRETDFDDLGSTSIEDSYSQIVGDLGRDTAAAQMILSNQEALMATLDRQREAVSGVNVDEEMVDMVRFQQAFEAAARLIETVNELSSTLINLAR